MKNNRIKIVFFLFLATNFVLFLFSFTQIDLSLTFSRINLLRNIVKSFQYVGYFNRHLSAVIFSVLVLLLFGFYFYFLRLAQKNKLDKRFVWKIILTTCVILVFSYNAFSYDLFNYIFDAKIYTHYNLNPYLHKALDFPGDPMLSFMRWTHRVYPYGPIWLILTVPLSYIGMNLFLPTVFLFKLLVASSFIGSLYFISKIYRKISPSKEVLGLSAFGLNPLVVVEVLVSGHLDIVMIFFSLWATYKLIEKKYIFAIVLLLISIGVKFSTVFLLPLFIVTIFLRHKNLKDWSLFFKIATLLMIITVYFSSIYSGNFQPWYLLLPLSFAVFLYDRYYVLIPSFIFSLIALATYTPYLYLGNGEDSVTQIMYQLLIAGGVLSILCVASYYFQRKWFASKGTI
ncbi:MAG TPA: hypothetical protein VM077_01890 [Candidatus Limnocylindrales bacterium]|nr:hypothetical protein [Candidatus Limnocylindrales bacterium]